MLIKLRENSLLKKLKKGEVNSFIVCPGKCSPRSEFSATQTSEELQKDGRLEDNFKNLVNSFFYYSCNDELGNNLHFFVEKPDEKGG